MLIQNFWSYYWEVELTVLLTLFIFFTFFIELKSSAVSSLCLMVFFSSLLFLIVLHTPLSVEWVVDSPKLILQNNTIFLIFGVLFLVISIYLWQIFFTKQNEKIEFATLIFFVLLLGLLIFKIADLLEAFLIIEGLSFIAYILAGFEKDTKTASSVGIQYLIIGSISSIFLVISILLVYYQFSSSNLLNISTANLFYQNTTEKIISPSFLETIYSFQNTDLSDSTSLLLDSSKTIVREKDFINGQHNFPDILLTNKAETEIFDIESLSKFSQALTVPFLGASVASRESLDKVSYTTTTLDKSFVHSWHPDLGFLSRNIDDAYFSTIHDFVSLTQWRLALGPAQSFFEVLGLKTLFNDKGELMVESETSANLQYTLSMTSDQINYSILKFQEWEEFFASDFLSSSFKLLEKIANEETLNAITQEILSIDNTQVIENFYTFDSLVYGIVLLNLSFLIGALLYKIKGAPFHVWAPTIYTRMPTSSMVVLITLFTVIFSLFFFEIFAVAFNEYELIISQLFLLTGFLSLIFGFLGAFDQKILKKFFVYSSVGHVAFLLFTFTLQTSLRSFTALIVYLIIYTISTLLLWYMITFNNQQVNFLSSLLKNIKENSFFLFLFIVIVFSMSGIPPLAGFYIKFDVLSLLILSGEYFILFASLLITVASFYYYLRLLKISSFENKKILIFNPLKIERIWYFLRLITLFLFTPVLLCYPLVFEQGFFYLLSQIF